MSNTHNPSRSEVEVGVLAPILDIMQDQEQDHLSIPTIIPKIHRHATAITSTPKVLKLALADLGGLKIRIQNYDHVARESAYIRLQGNMRKRTATDTREPIELVLHGISDTCALKATLKWATYSTPETIHQFVASTRSNPTRIEYLYQLLCLYRIAQRLVMKRLQHQILDLFNMDTLRKKLTPTQILPVAFLALRRMPSYGQLGLYLRAWTELLHAELLRGNWSIEAVLPLIDTMQLLHSDPQIKLARVKLEHKSNISKMAELWQIDLVDDLPHRFSVFPKDVLGPDRKVLGFQDEEKEDVEMMDAELLDEEYGFEADNDKNS